MFEQRNFFAMCSTKYIHEARRNPEYRISQANVCKEYQLGCRPNSQSPSRLVITSFLMHAILFLSTLVPLSIAPPTTTSSAPVTVTTCGSRVYTYNELVGYGFMWNT